MIIESRQLVFSESALLKVFRWYATAPTQTIFPHGLVSSIELPDKPPLHLEVRMQRPGASRFDVVVFPESKLIGALLYFCKKQKIPVPRDAEKNVWVDGDALVLDISRKIVSTAPP